MIFLFIVAIISAFLLFKTFPLFNYGEGFDECKKFFANNFCECQYKTYIPSDLCAKLIK